MISRLLIFFCLLLTCSTFYSSDVKAVDRSELNDDLLEERYKEAKYYYNQLHSNPSLYSHRENWLKGTRNFRRIYLLSPKSQLAPGCLFMLGKIYGEMHDRFSNQLDLDESASYYKDILRLFPNHRLTDDAYFALARIALDKNQDPKKAAEYLSVVVNSHSGSDMFGKAEDLLMQLSVTNNIALPKVMISSSRDNRLNYVLPVKYWSSDSYTRVVIMASGPVNYKEELLEKTKNRPRRLYIDFSQSYIEPQYRAPIPIEDGLLRSIRTAQNSPDTVRVVLDIESIDSYKIFSLPDPFRVVIDVRGQQDRESGPQQSILRKKQKQLIEIDLAGNQDNETEIVTLRDQKKVAVKEDRKGPSEGIINQPQSGKQLSLAQQLGLGVKKIVIDPGHGGKDPGAMAFGLKEKDIVLQTAKVMASVLESRLGCDVILTRQNDIFIPLEERTAIANTENADLFISLHINAHPLTEVRGIETYFLNLTTNAEAMRVAALENATSTHQMSDLQDILSDIMQNSKIEESSRLAQLVHSSLMEEISKNGYSDIKNLGIKQAPFYVLIGAQMPAILIELGFITNKADADNLTNTTFIRLLAKEITDGIVSYISDTTAQINNRTAENSYF